MGSSTLKTKKPDEENKGEEKIGWIKHSRLIALIMLIVGGALMSIGSLDTPSSKLIGLPKGSDSAAVAEVMENMPDEGGNLALVLISNDEGVDMADMPRIQEITGTQAVIPSEDGNAFLAPVQIDQGSQQESAGFVNDLRENLANELGQDYTTQVTGPAAIAADLANVFEGANFTLLALTAGIVAVLLIVTYRSPVLWLIPLFVIAIADRLAATSFAYILDGLGMGWDDSTSGILSVLVFGAGTNYALLLISRYRDELTNYKSRFAAMAAAWKPTAHAVVASAFTVAIGVACLLLSATPATRGLGLSSAYGVLIAMLFVLFALPGALVAFDRWIFWPQKPNYGDKVEHKLWDKVAHTMVKKPVVLAIVSFIVLAIASLGGLGMKVGLSQEEQFLDTPESISAAADLERYFPDQGATPANIITKDPENVTTILEEAGATVNPAGEGDGYTVLSATGLETPEFRATLEGTDAKVGGPDAELLDKTDFAADDRMIIFPLVLVLVTVLLGFLLRAVVAPIVMVATVIATNLAALGIGWFVFTQFLGFDSLAETTPLYSFVFLVALGIDYNIFLVTRAREAAKTDPEDGMRGHVITALSTTGGVITSAGILLASVFAALGILPLVALAQIGVIIFVGVLLDTFVVRTVLMPSLMQLLGEKFWWPGNPSKEKVSEEEKRRAELGV